MTMVVFFWSCKVGTHHYGREYIRNKSSFDLTLSLDSQYFIAINYEWNVCILSLKTPNSWSGVMKVCGVIKLSSNPVTTCMRKGKGSSPPKHCACNAEENPTQEVNYLTNLSCTLDFSGFITYIHTKRYIWFGEGHVPLGEGLAF